MKKIGVISDTHLRSGAPLPARAAAAFEGVDMIIHAGDLTSESVLDELDVIAPVKAVCGNCDFDPDMDRTPPSRIIKVEKVRIGVVHVLSRSSRDFPRRAAELFPSAACIVFGHTHKPYNNWSGRQLLFNPGSATQRRSHPFTSVGILAVHGDEVSGDIVRID